MDVLKRSLLAAALASLLTSAAAVGDIPGNPDSLPGWLGAAPLFSGRTSGIDTTKVKQLSEWGPRAYLYEGFLSDEECDHIVNKAKTDPNMGRSIVTDSANGEGSLSDYRTSTGTFIGKGEDEIIKRIEQRIAEWTFLPVSHQEPLQVLRYNKGQKYSPHVDYFPDQQNRQRGGHRYATILMYLSDVAKGGETAFPMHNDPTPKDGSWSDCANGVLAVKAKKGNAVLFFDMHPDGSPDPTSMHYACPVIEGIKWSAPMWVHVAPYDRIYRPPGECSDTNDMCQAWAARGECKTNPVFMEDVCQRSCRKCLEDGVKS